MYKRKDLQKALAARSYKNIRFEQENIVVRTCLNVTLKDGKIQDDTRLNESLPLIRELAGRANRVVLLAHLGRPEHKEPEFSLRPVAKELEARLGEKILFCESVEASEVDALTKPAQKDARIVLIENIRFFAEENSKDPAVQDGFSAKLAKLGTVFINDAFADYRESPSTYGIAKIMPAFVGPALSKEIEALGKLSAPERPFYAVMGGVKLSEKLDSLKALLEVADKVMVGGALAYTLLQANGNTVGKSLVEAEKIGVAEEILKKFRDKLVLPVDHIALYEFKKPETADKYILVTAQNIPEDLLGVDIGPKTRALYAEILSSAETILWNGPMGVYEWGKSAEGTDAVLEAMAQNNRAYKLIGGGDSITVTNQLQGSGFNHISTGGGAMLAFMAYEKFPVLDVILDQA